MRPMRSQQYVVWRYVAAALLSLAFIAVAWAIGQFVGNDIAIAILSIPIALSAFYGGLGPGLVSVMILMTLADYFLIPPIYTLGLPDVKSVSTDLVLGISGLVLCGLGEIGRNALLQASNDAEILRVAQHQLLVNEERFRITEQLVSGGVWDWDVQRGTVYWSDGFKRLCDFSLDEQPSYDSWVQSLHPEDHDRVLSELNEMFAKKGHNWSSEYRIRTATGRSRWVASRGQAIYDESGQPRRMVGINVDVTARHYGENGVRLANARAGSR
jgi:PAS domain S-box-containing protein